MCNLVNAIVDGAILDDGYLARHKDVDSRDNISPIVQVDRVDDVRNSRIEKAYTQAPLVRRMGRVQIIEVDAERIFDIVFVIFAV